MVEFLLETKELCSNNGYFVTEVHMQRIDCQLLLRLRVLQECFIDLKKYLLVRRNQSINQSVFSESRLV